jgi:S1-C subfamily serine protease
MSTEPPFKRLYSDVIPSVVSVYVTPRNAGRAGPTAAGSGFVYDDGHVVTNQHVGGRAEGVDLRFSEGDWSSARVVGSDAYTDLAVVRAENLPRYATPLAVAEENPVPGEPVATLGNPMGLEGRSRRAW